MTLRKKKAGSDKTKGFFLFLLLVLTSCLGCGTLKNGRGWGQDAFSDLSLRRISRCAVDALLEPHTWVPAAGALVFSIDDFDEKTSDWAVDHTPIFGSRSQAEDTGNILLHILEAETVSTLLATPSGDRFGEWLAWKGKGFAAEGLAWGVTMGVTSVLKRMTDRRRPLELNDNSFPSGHASSAFSHAALSCRNLDSIPMNDRLRNTIKVGNYVLASATAWARVEQGKHFPSDVLAGAALGNFLTTFLHDVFLGLGHDESYSLSIRPTEEGAMVNLSIRF